MLLRRIVTPLLLAACALPLASQPSQGAPSTVSASSCSDVVLYGIRGSGQAVTSSQGRPVGFGWQAGTHALAIAHRLRTSSTGARSVGYEYDAYPASPVTPNALGTATAEAALDASARTGVTQALKDLESIADRCPRTRVVVVGYSQGGLVADLLARALADPANAKAARPLAALVSLASAGRHSVDPGAVQLLITGTARWDGMMGSHVPGPTTGPAAKRLLQVCNSLDKACNQEPGTKLYLTEEHSAPYLTDRVLAATSSWVHRVVTGHA